MMLQPSEEEYEALLKCKEEKDPEKSRCGITNIAN